MNRLILSLLATLMVTLLCFGVSKDSHSASLAIINETLPDTARNIQYFGGGPWPVDCPFEGGGSVILNNNDSVKCIGLPAGTYSITEALGPFSAELECNMPVTPQLPGVISFSANLDMDDDLICRIVNTQAVPLLKSKILPNIINAENRISVQSPEPFTEVAIIWSFTPGEDRYEATPECFESRVDIKNPRLFRIVETNANGIGTIRFPLNARADGLTVVVQALTLDHCLQSSTITQELGIGQDS